MSDTIPLVAVIDDNESVRDSLPDLLRELGFAARAYRSAEAFLDSDHLHRTSCLLVDIAMPGMSGPELLQELRRRGQDTPVVFITGRRDETIRPRLVGEGAVDCLFKPFSEAALLAALKTAHKVA